MPSRFRGRNGGANAQGLARAGNAARSDGFGEWWAAIAVISLALLAIVSLSGGASPPALPPVSAAPPSVPDPSPRLLSAISPAESSLAAVESAFASLCREPVLIGLELEPDCETGVITLPDELFKSGGGATLGAGAKEYVAAAMTTYLSRLRRLPALWDSIEAIEFRGHSDPRALRNAYETNLVASQQKALGVLLFLVGPDGLSESDAADLERLASVSGVSYSRPPEACPDRDRSCYRQWRRVEIRPVLSESLRRGDWARTVEDLRVTALRIQQEFGRQAVE